jgi:hypothetical protein
MRTCVAHVNRCVDGRHSGQALGTKRQGPRPGPCCSPYGRTRPSQYPGRCFAWATTSTRTSSSRTRKTSAYGKRASNARRISRFAVYVLKPRKRTRAVSDEGKNGLYLFDEFNPQPLSFAFVPDDHFGELVRDFRREPKVGHFRGRERRSSTRVRVSPQLRPGRPPTAAWARRSTSVTHASPSRVSMSGSRLARSSAATRARSPSESWRASLSTSSALVAIGGSLPPFVGHTRARFVVAADPLLLKVAHWLTAQPGAQENGIHQVRGSMPLSSANSSNNLAALHPRRRRAK